MFGSDFTKFIKEGENTLPAYDKEYLALRKRILNHKTETQNVSLKVLFYSTKTDFTSKFLKHFGFQISKSNFTTANGVELVSTYREYDDTIFHFSLWIIKLQNIANKYLEQFYHNGAKVVIIYNDPKDNEYVFKLRELINRLKRYSKAKYLLVFEKNDVNQVLKEIVKSLKEEDTIHGVYKLDKDRDNDDHLFKEIIRVGTLKTISN